MRLQTTKRFASRENLFVVVFLFFYAAILLSSDPEWLMWAGPITLGAFPITSPGVSPAFDPLDVFQAASYSVLPGLLALFILTSFRGKGHGSRRSTIPGPAAGESRGLAHGPREQRKAA